MFENIPYWAMNQNQNQQSAFNAMPSILSQYSQAGGARPQPTAAPAPIPGPQQTQQPQQQNPMGDPMALMKLLTNSNNPQTASQGSGGMIQQIAAMLNGRQSQSMRQATDDFGNPLETIPGASNGGLGGSGGGLMGLFSLLQQFGGALGL